MFDTPSSSSAVFLIGATNVYAASICASVREPSCELQIVDLSVPLSGCLEVPTLARSLPFLTSSIVDEPWTVLPLYTFSHPFHSYSGVSRYDSEILSLIYLGRCLAVNQLCQ
jgi:hypothetical protein